ncbi:hypothetical protein [Plantactinospora sp. GCM10030261]|uniref:hypothetical protein n=1 Tax=Plantactinospora sp. GCM10030261 TaxID=3273420 RepID=UPI00360A31F9
MPASPKTCQRAARAACGGRRPRGTADAIAPADDPAGDQWRSHRAFVDLVDWREEGT